MNEYKIFCNYGEPKLINVVYGRQVEYKGNASECFTDAKLNILNAKQSLDLISQDKLIIPPCFQEMINICKKVTINFPMIRVDFLVYKNNFYFCEFTFVDCAGMAIFEPKEANYMIGDMFDLQENKR